MTNVTLAILAGGQSTRMGSPKHLIPVAGRPMFRFLLDSLNWAGPKMIVLSPDAQIRDLPDDVVVARDAVEGAGPLQGVWTALTHATTELTIVATVDMPRVDLTCLSFLTERMQPDCSGILLSRMNRTQRLIEPFPSIYTRSAIKPIEKRLAACRRSVHGLTEEAGFEVIPVPDDWPASIWMNLNTPRELQAYLSQFD